MMGGVSSKTYWAIKKHWNNKFYYTVETCWFFLWDLYYDARIHEHQVNIKLYLDIPPLNMGPLQYLETSATDTTSYPRRTESLATPLRKTQNLEILIYFHYVQINIIFS